MIKIAIFFILTNGPAGYTPPQIVQKSEMSCGLEGAIVGVQLDRLVNPTTVYWPDPTVANFHCAISIKDRVVGLQQGEYHIATTIIADNSGNRYFQHDPHTTVYWTRINGTGIAPNKPGKISLRGQ